MRTADARRLVKENDALHGLVYELRTELQAARERICELESHVVAFTTIEDPAMSSARVAELEAELEKESA